MVYNLITSKKAEDDIDQAVGWYVNISIELAQRFILELKAVKTYIVKNPKKFNFVTITSELLF